LRFFYSRKEDDSMRQQTKLLPFVLAGALFSFPIKAFAVDSPMNPIAPQPSARGPADESAYQVDPTEPFETAALDYCYNGSIVDPTTGELVDLYVLCA
jgi:hypothetical protein